MTKTVRAHFDGRVFIPDEPVDVPLNEPLQIEVRQLSSSPAETRSAPLAELLKFVDGLPPAAGDSLPDDLAMQHDHYLYGLPKRP